MRSALEIAGDRVERMELHKVPAFTYTPPVSQRTIDRWQAMLDREYPRGPRFAHVMVRWEPGDPWESIGRFFLWQTVDPRFVQIEPWVLNALQGPSPRSTGHMCRDGYCLCELKRNRWHGGQGRHIDQHQWRIYQETGRYATRWWVVQGTNGGHRYQWDREEIASIVSQMKTGNAQPPDAGSLPYAPFDTRVLKAIRSEHNAAKASTRLLDLWKRKESLAKAEHAVALETQKVLWEWAGDQAEALWNEGGADRLPRFFEDQYGRAPIGHKLTTDYEAVEERMLTSVG